MSVTLLLPLYDDVNAPFDWNSVKDRLYAPYLSADAFDTIFAQFASAMGDTTGDFLCVLRDSFAVLPDLPDNYQDAMNALVQEAFDRFAATVNTSIRGPHRLRIVGS